MIMRKNAHSRSYILNKTVIRLTVSVANNRFKGQLQRKYKSLSYERAFKMLKNDVCITIISQAILEIFHFKLDIQRESPKIIGRPSPKSKVGF